MRGKKKETFQDLIETDSHECATTICVYTHSEKKIKINKTSSVNRPHAS